jgi:hypothetical protein
MAFAVFNISINQEAWTAAVEQWTTNVLEAVHVWTFHARATIEKFCTSPHVQSAVASLSV